MFNFKVETNNSVEAITAQMNRMVTDLLSLAQRREELSAAALKEAEALEAKAQADYDEAVKARSVASKIGELIG